MIGDLPREFLARLDEAVASGVISPPQISGVPKGFPFSIATVAVDLPDGCRPPRSAPRRVAVGRGETDEEASLLALAEGVERYSLQFHRGLPEELEPFVFSGGRKLSTTTDCILLGAPGATERVTSKGTAAGCTLEDAGRRALLELIEEHCVQAFQDDCHSLMGLFESVPSSTLGSLIAWLKKQYRRLHLRLRNFEGCCWVAVALLSDFDGARPTEGAAAGLDPLLALQHAAWEAVFHWRNMVALEMNAITTECMSDADRSAVMVYRGALPRPNWPMGKSRTARLEPIPEIGIEELMKHFAGYCGRPVELFDLTHPEIGVPVVRARARLTT